MEGNDGLSRACGTRDARRTGERLLDDIALRWMKENRPFLPGVFERELQLFHVFHYAKPAQRIRMRKGINLVGDGRGMHHPSRCVFKESFRGFGGKVTC